VTGKDVAWLLTVTRIEVAPEGAPPGTVNLSEVAEHGGIRVTGTPPMVTLSLAQVESKCVPARLMVLPLLSGAVVAVAEVIVGSTLRVTFAEPVAFVAVPFSVKE
jgi:hypothetical protein